MAQPTSSALRALALEYKSLQEEPVEGFRVKLVNEDNMFEWEVAIFGPPDTLYQGGYFKVSFFSLTRLTYPPFCNQVQYTYHTLAHIYIAHHGARACVSTYAHIYIRDKRRFLFRELRHIHARTGFLKGGFKCLSSPPNSACAMCMSVCT